MPPPDCRSLSVNDTPTNSSAAEGVRVAYVVLAHADPAHLARMLGRLEDPRSHAFVHVDAKSGLGPFLDATRHLSRVTFLRDRVRVMWAGFSQVEATLRLLSAALDATSPGCGRFVLLSGADYPIACNDEIHATLAADPAKQHVRRFEVMRSGDGRQVRRIRNVHFREVADRFTLWRKPLFAIETLLRAFPRSLPDDVTFALGSQWIALTRDCAAHCVARARSDHALTALFRPMFAPDEIFFHTLVQNSPFASDADPIEPYVDVTLVGGPFAYANLHALVPDVPVRTAGRAREILSGREGRLFSRKFSTEASQAALDVIDASLDGRGGA